MVTKLICQLPDVDAFGRKGRLSFDPKHVQDLGLTPNDWKYKFNPDYVKDVVDATQNMLKQGSLLSLRNILNICFIWTCQSSDLDMGKKTPNIWVNLPNVAVKWQSLPDQYRKAPNFQDWTVKRTL